MNELKNSITLKESNASIQVPEGIQFQANYFLFKNDGKEFTIHVFPNNKAVVVITSPNGSEIISNAELTKVNESTVDVNF